MANDIRPYQTKNRAEILQAWAAGARNVLSVLPTGAGKTFIFTLIVAEEQGPSCVIAHRGELLGQISLALAKRQIRHAVIAPKHIIKWLVSYHVQEVGRSWYDPDALCKVASAQTLVSRPAAPWMQDVRLWVIDEGHHVLKSNTWGKAVSMFPNARGLAVTATPCRADSRGLGRHADGFIDTMVIGPTMRELINQGYLSDYRVFAPPTKLDLSDVPIGASGDYSHKPLTLKIRESKIVGDVVEHYLRIAPGKLGVTFTTDVQTASEMAEKYRQAGIPAEVVTAKTPDRTRVEILRRFRRKEIIQLVNVDLFGEGFDLPALEVVTMARPTESYGLYCQQFGRGLRVMPGKDKAIIIDHVGNVVRHGLPDAGRQWTLDRRDKRARSTDKPEIPLKVCVNPQCMAPYPATLVCCPHCGTVRKPAARSLPEQVDGDLFELDPAYLAALRGEIDRIDAPAESVVRKMLNSGASAIVAAGAGKQHRLRKEAQEKLRAAIAQWAGVMQFKGIPDKESYRRFYYLFGTDVKTAQTLGRPDAEILTEKVWRSINEECRMVV